MRSKWKLPVAALALLLAACSEDRGIVDPPTDVEEAQAPGFGVAEGAVYVMSNDGSANEVLVFDRAADGTLTPAGSYATGGTGTGGGLGNQGALNLSWNKRFLFVVNAGSNDISSFAVHADGLTLVDRVPSGGETPVSVTSHLNRLFVLNAGGDGNISGFRVSGHGELTPLAGSTRPLGSDAAGAAQVQFSPDGLRLAVTEKATNTISTYVVKFGGQISGPNTHAAAGVVPFGFDFTPRSVMVVSEANPGVPGGSTVSSYELDFFGGLDVITGALGTTQSAACWLVVTRDGRYAFTANTPNASISAVRIHGDGSLSLLDPQAALTGEGSSPLDIALSSLDRFLYVRNGAGNVGAYQVGPGGSLTHVGDFGSLPAGANGIAAH